MRIITTILFLYSSLLMAHQTSTTTTQKEIRWNFKNVPLKVNSPSSSMTTVIDQSINNWNSSSSTKIQKVSSGNNQLKFESDFSMYGSAVVGVTELSYSTSGVINTASILLNDQDYDFTTIPGMPIGNQIYVGDVVTHELGHFLGLGHSEVLNASMFYANYPGQSSLSSDDKAGIRAKYDSGYGIISGYVKGGNHIGVLGVHVQAISRRTGETISSISDESGRFAIEGLDLNDTYYLYTSPLKNLDALPYYYANVQNEFCPSSYVGSFYTPCGRQNDGLPQGITLTASQPTKEVGEVSINCTVRSSEDYNFEKIQSSFMPLSIWDYADEPRVEKSYVGFFRNADLSTSSYSEADKFEVDLRSFNPSGSAKTLKVQLISQPFGNPVEYSVSIKRDGIPVVGSPFGKTATMPEWTYNLDINTHASLSSTASRNFFEIEIKAKKLSTVDTAYSIPSFGLFGSNQSLPYLLTLSLWEDGEPYLDTESELSDNYSCLDAPFTYAVEKSKYDSNDASVDSQVATATAASCGTIEPPSDGGGPSGFFAIISFGFFLATLASRFAKRGKNFLS